MSRTDKIFFITTNGMMMTGYDIITASIITEGNNIDPFDLDTIRKYASKCVGIKEELINPSIEDLLKYGKKAEAAIMYRDKNPDIPYTECIKAINKIANDLLFGDKE